MPCINIKAFESKKSVDAKSLAKEVSKLSGIDISRVNIIIDYYSEVDFFRSSLDNGPIVFISISEKNGKEIIQKLANVVSQLTEKYFSVQENSVAVFCNSVGSGYLLVNNNFK